MNFWKWLCNALGIGYYADKSNEIQPTVPQKETQANPTQPVVSPAKPAESVGTVNPSQGSGSTVGGAGGALTMLKGGDFSHYDPVTDWKLYAATGHAFAAAKISDGAGGIDSKGQSQRAGCHSVGLPFLGYHFFRFGANARAQARDFYKAFGPLQKGEGWAADYEWDNLSGISRYANGGQTDAAGNDQFMTFIEEAEQLFGLGAIIYTGKSFMPMKDPRFSSRKLWVFDWHTTGKQMPTANQKPILPPSWESYTLWQFSDREQTAGVGRVDMNAFRGSLSDLKALCR